VTRFYNFHAITRYFDLCEQKTPSMPFFTTGRRFFETDLRTPTLAVKTTMMHWSKCAFECLCHPLHLIFIWTCRHANDEPTFEQRINIVRVALNLVSSDVDMHSTLHRLHSLLMCTKQHIANIKLGQICALSYS
jgi:hypothetical protein